MEWCEFFGESGSSEALIEELLKVVLSQRDTEWMGLPLPVVEELLWESLVHAHP